jgi:hypothetical protein
LVASSLVVALTMSAQPASATTQGASSISGLQSGSSASHDPYDPTYPGSWGGGFLHHNAYGPGYHYHPSWW